MIIGLLSRVNGLEGAGEEDPLMRVSMEEEACCLRIISLWHLEHMYIVAALPKNPQLFTQRIGPSGV